MLTKPLQGMTFRKMQAELMNCNVMYEERDEDETPSRSSLLTGREKPALPSQTLQECVGQKSSNALKLVADRRVGEACIVKRKVTSSLGKRGRKHLKGKAQ